MSTEYAVAVIGGLMAMLGWGLADFFAKISVDALEELTALVWGHVFATVLLIAASSFNWGSLSAGQFGGTGGIAALIGLGIVQGIVYMLLYRGFGKGEVARLSPVFASFAGPVALVSILFLGDSINLFRGFVLTGLFVGVILLSTTDGVPLLRGLGRTPGFREVALGAVLAAGWTLGWSQVVDGHDALTSAAIMYAAMTGFFIVTAKIMKVNLRVPRTARLVLGGIGGGEAAAYAGISWGYSVGSHVSVVALLSGAFSLPTMLLAAKFLGERLGRAATVGAFLVLACSGLLAVAQ